jgi:hypothetical protein
VGFWGYTDSSSYIIGSLRYFMVEISSGIGTRATDEAYFGRFELL